jgi:hypothetical protein
MNSQLLFSCRAVAYNGYPKIQIFLDEEELPAVEINSDIFDFALTIDKDRKKRTIKIERYGKTFGNTQVDEQGKIIQDQILEIIDIKIDNISIPKFLIYQNTRFEFDKQSHVGSCYFGPNGVWTFDFETPLIEYILDQKIIHEAKFNQDYLLPWSYKLGPDSVNSIAAEINSAIDRVISLYE